MKDKIYLDTNQLYYIRKIAEEAEGYDYGDYSWAYNRFKDSPEMIQDIRALCYIIALQNEWDLERSKILEWGISGISPKGNSSRK